MTLDEFFEGRDAARQLFETVRSSILLIGAATLRLDKSQIAFRRRRGFAFVWIPGRYLHGQVAPLVLTIGLRRHDTSPRWKEVVEPYPGRFIHHLELHSAADIDEEVRALLAEAWNLAA
jgi:hypothetical protein